MKSWPSTRILTPSETFSVATAQNPIPEILQKPESGISIFLGLRCYSHMLTFLISCKIYSFYGHTSILPCYFLLPRQFSSSIFYQLYVFSDFIYKNPSIKVCCFPCFPTYYSPSQKPTPRDKPCIFTLFGIVSHLKILNIVKSISENNFPTGFH